MTGVKSLKLDLLDSLYFIISYGCYQMITRSCSGKNIAPSVMPNA